MKKILVIIGASLLMVILVACNNNGIHDEPDDPSVGDIVGNNETNNGYDSTENIVTVTFNVEIIEIHDEPRPAGVLGYHTILARSIDDQIIGDFSFDHLDLPDIGASVGDIVTITAHSDWLDLYPAIPLWVISWSLAG